MLESGVEAKSIPGGSLLLIHKGEVVFREAVGLAGIEHKRPFTTDSLCWLASVTKPYTATLLVILAERGKLKLDEPIDKYLPAFAGVRVRDLGRANNRPTIRQLLCHTGGLSAGPDLEGGAAAFRSAATLAETVDYLARQELAYEPGSRHVYTSIGYLVAGRVAEIATGQEFGTLMHKTLLEPLGSPRVTFEPSADSQSRIPATYERFAGGFRLWKAPEVKPFPRPGGGMYATLDDVGRFLLLHRNRGKVNGRQLVGARSLEQMYVPRKATPGEGYGLGFNILRKGADGRGRRVRHTGSSGTLAWIDFDADLIVVLFTQVPGNQDMRFLDRVMKEIAGLFPDGSSGR